MVAFFFETSPLTMAVRSSAFETALNPSLPSSLTWALLAAALSCAAGTTTILRAFNAFSTAARLAASPGPVNVITPTFGGAPCGLPPWPFALARAGPGAATAIAAAKATSNRAKERGRTREGNRVVLYVREGYGDN